jgi:hypothetical protein
MSVENASDTGSLPSSIATLAFNTAHADQRFEERDIVKRQFQAAVKSARNPRVSEVPLSDEQVDPGYDEGNALEMLCHEHVGRARGLYYLVHAAVQRRRLRRQSGSVHRRAVC